MSNNMPKSNDAVASWSGYNYQGKMMLLCTLLKLQDLLKNKKEYTDYWAEVEAKEDFVIGRGSEGSELDQSFYQVKAMLASKTVNAYVKDSKKNGKMIKSPLYKLLDARNKTDRTKTSQCWLISAVEIKNWDDRGSHDTSFKEVQLYRYPKTGKIVGVEEVIGHIKDVIRELLVENYPSITLIKVPNQEDVVYGNLCQFIERKISWIHQKHVTMKTSVYKRVDYRIDFKLLVDEINQTGSMINDQSEFFLKEKCYESIARLWQAGFQNCCENCNYYNEDATCEQDCAAREALDLYLSCGNPEAFWKLFCPEETDWSEPLRILGRLEMNQLSAKLFQPISSAKDSSKVALQESHFVLDAEAALEKAMNQDGIPIDHPEKTTIIPTLLNLSDRTDRAIGKKLDELYKNRVARNAFADCVVTAQEENGNPYITRWSHQQINEVWQGYSETSPHFGEAINPGHKSFRILSIETLAQKLEEERNKDVNDD